jgi:hypothetical protein
MLTPKSWRSHWNIGRKSRAAIQSRLRTHVCPYDAISLLTGIRFDLDTLFQAAASGSAGMSITAPVTSYFDP